MLYFKGHTNHIICKKVMALFRIWLIWDGKGLCVLCKLSCFYVTVKYRDLYLKKYIYQASNAAGAIRPGVGPAVP